ncbi:Sodium/hydrogen exchanger 9B2 [Collichthys lucidus]|uniref:Sodium/hydrogen exchanger 9B2 n=1 Tax=Collichthys lucidus TaxID=240159 RepID=A0A4U5VWU7_COLLU|nr:Sodium/hydrogen exchanger 9B2 [Collichthys lucidus]
MDEEATKRYCQTSDEGQSQKPAEGLLNLLITKGSECLPGGNLFGIVILFICSVLGGKLVGMIQLPTLPPFPPLLGMLLAGLLLRNVPYITDAVYIDTHWSAALRNIALSIILTRAGLGLDPSGIPTLLMAAGSFDDILAITGFSTCLGIAFSTGATWMNILKGLLEVVGGVIAGLVLGLFLCCFPVKTSHVIGFAGAGGLCTLVLAFLAALGWKTNKAPVAAMVGRSWDIFQPILFGLIGAEITIANLSPSTVGKKHTLNNQTEYDLDHVGTNCFYTLCWSALGSGLGLACISIGLVIRLLITFLLVHFGGFNLKEKFFISVAWLPKATVQVCVYTNET